VELDEVIAEQAFLSFPTFPWNFDVGLGHMDLHALQTEAKSKPVP
jgi:hypothetical protein